MPKHVSPFSRRSVRRGLAGLVAACVLPVWICAGYLVYFAYTGKKTLIESHMAETARGLALAVDRELTIVQAATEGLTTSPALVHDDFAAFRLQVRQLQQSYPHSDIVVADRSGQQIFNSYKPEGAPLPKRNDLELVWRIFETGRPVISNYFRGAVTGRGLVSLDLPVFRDGQVYYDLGVTVPAVRFAGILEKQPLPPEWVATILDAKNTVVARTRRAEQLMGQPADIALPHLAEGVLESEPFETVNLEGVPILAILAQADVSDWSVLVSVPRRVLMAELWQWLLWTAGGTATLSLLGIGLAVALGNGIARSIQALGPPAQALGEGRPVVLGAFTLVETDAVARALESASRLLQTRATEREAAEARRIEAEERLAEREQIFRIVADNSHNWEYWNGPDGVCRWVSPACHRITGYDPEDFQGPGGIDLREIIHPADRPLWDAHNAQLAEDATAHEEIYFRIFSRDGAIIHIGHVCSPIPTLDGPPLGRRCCNRDVTAQYRYEQALREAKDMADTANRAKSEFLANMSHEIRTPLNGVLSMLQLLDTTSLDLEQAEYVRMAVGASKRLSRLLADILDLSKVESGKMTLRETTFPLEDIRQAVLDIFAPMARKKGLDLVIELDPRLPAQLVGDDIRLRQILLNLVGNAVKYTEHGGIRVQVAPGLQGLAAGGAPDAQRVPPVVFSVADTGPGIPADQREAIFEPFVQTEASYTRRSGGVGLGLAIVKRLVALMGGVIELASVEGRGTTMRVSLPLAPAVAQTAPDDPAVPAATPARALAVLVVEDDALNRLAIQRLLEKGGYRPTSCQNGAEALELLARESFDLVLMDVQMPVMDGLEAIRRIRADTSGRFDPAIAVIAMTAYAMDGDRERILAAGMDDYVAKPVDFDQLVLVLERVVAARGRTEGGAGTRRAVAEFEKRA